MSSPKNIVTKDNLDSKVKALGGSWVYVAGALRIKPRNGPSGANFRSSGPFSLPTCWNQVIPISFECL